MDTSRDIEERLSAREEADRALLSEAGKTLYALLEERIENKQAPATCIYLTKGARLLPYFVKGLTKDLDWKPQHRFVQCSMKQESDAQMREEHEQIRQRVAEVIRTTKPPYLIFDEFTSHQHTTFTFIQSVFRELGIEEKDIICFAFVGASAIPWSDGEPPLTKEHYAKERIIVGTLDPRGWSFPLEYDHVLGTKKDMRTPYEQVDPDLHFEEMEQGWFNAKKAKAERIREGIQSVRRFFRRSGKQVLKQIRKEKESEESPE